MFFPNDLQLHCRKSFIFSLRNRFESTTDYSIIKAIKFGMFDKFDSRLYETNYNWGSNEKEEGGDRDYEPYKFTVPTLPIEK